MPPRKFDKKTATTYALVHRAQNDPLIHSSDAPQMVFAEISRGAEPSDPSFASSSSASLSGYSQASGKARQRGDLDEEFGFAFNKNEGQAAEQGIYYDDTSYDYMQHMRDLGGRDGGGEVAWVPASQTSKQAKLDAKAKGKQKQSLEDALAALDVVDERDELASQGGVSLASASSAASLLPSDMLPSEFVQKRTYQDQQDVPDAIAGFQPDMDPRLREVLEALEDDAYVDDDEDVFGRLTGEGGEEVDEEDFEATFFGATEGHDRMDAFLDSQGDEDEGWESDDTVRAGEKDHDTDQGTPSILPPEDPNATPAADPSNGAWLSEYSKFKSTLKAATAARAEQTAQSRPRAAAAPSESLASRSALSSLAAGRRKKRPGAKTSTTNYSMTSSALARTDQQSLLDDRFDRLMTVYDADEEQYGDQGNDDDNDNDGASLVSGVSGVSGLSRASRYSRADSLASGVSRASGISTYSRADDREAPQLVRADFDSIMDGFLDGQTRKGGSGRRDPGVAPGRKGKRGANGEGLRELDEIRQGLGAARVR